MGFGGHSTPPPPKIPVPPPAAAPATFASTQAQANTANKQAAAALAGNTVGASGARGLSDVKTAKTSLLGGGSGS